MTPALWVCNFKDSMKPNKLKKSGSKASPEDLVNQLVQENLGWAEAIARSVARAWNLDWQLDGLDGGAFEALLFCARRYDPSLGVPFRAYARKRIHEASSEEARKSKSWQKGVGTNSVAEQDSREISYRLFELFPELREGYLPESSGDGTDVMRTSVRQLLTSAAMVAAFNESGRDNPEKAFEYKILLECLALLEPVHQQIMWAIYWGGQSMRSLAEEWAIDELTVIREHKEILRFVEQALQNPKNRNNKPIKVRPSLKNVVRLLISKKTEPPFGQFSTSTLLLFALTFGLLQY